MVAEFYFKKELPIIDLFLAILKRLLYDKDRTLKLYLPLNEKAISSAINFVSLFSSLAPSYKIIFPNKKRLLRYKWKNKFNIYIKINKSLKFNENIILENYYTMTSFYIRLSKNNLRYSKISVGGEINRKKKKLKNAFLEKLLQEIKYEFHLSKYIDKGLSGFISFKYKNPFPFKAYLPFIDDKLERAIITKKGMIKDGYLLSKNNYFKLPYKISEFIRNFLHTFSLKTFTLFLIDIITNKYGEKTLEELCREHDENIGMFKRKIKNVEEKLYGVFEAILKEAEGKCSISDFLRENHQLFEIPLGYEAYFLKDILKAISYFMNPNSKEQERGEMLLDFYNHFAARDGKKIRKKEEFYNKKQTDNFKKFSTFFNYGK